MPHPCGVRCLSCVPGLVVNAGGIQRADSAELIPARCFRENTLGAHMLARECEPRKISFLTFSSDLVFDGRKNEAYIERDGKAPLSVYGRSKAEAERLVEQAMSSALIVRSGAFFGPWDESNFVFYALRALAAGHHFFAANNVVVSPTYVPDLVNACLDLLIDGERGIWHLAMWPDFLVRVGRKKWHRSRELIRRSLFPALWSSCIFRAARPLFSALSSERAVLMPSFEDALGRYFQDCEVDWRVREQCPQRLAA